MIFYNEATPPGPVLWERIGSDFVEFTVVWLLHLVPSISTNIDSGTDLLLSFRHQRITLRIVSLELNLTHLLSARVTTS